MYLFNNINEQTIIHNSVKSFISKLENELSNNKKVYYSIDRFERKFAILENRSTLNTKNVSFANLPKGIKKNVILKLKNGKYVIDKNETEKVNNRIKVKVNILYK